MDAALNIVESTMAAGLPDLMTANGNATEIAWTDAVKMIAAAIDPAIGMMTTTPAATIGSAMTVTVTTDVVSVMTATGKIDNGTAITGSAMIIATATTEGTIVSMTGAAMTESVTGVTTDTEKRGFLTVAGSMSLARMTPSEKLSSDLTSCAASGMTRTSGITTTMLSFGSF